MYSKLSNNIIQEINKFRSNPKSFKKDLELKLNKLIHLNQPIKPILDEIGTFIKSLDSFPRLPILKYNNDLTEIIKKELQNSKNKLLYPKYKIIEKLKLNYFENPQIIVINIKNKFDVVSHILFENLDKFKIRKDILCQQKLNQIGIKVIVKKENEDNKIFLIFANIIQNKPKIENNSNKIQNNKRERTEYSKYQPNFYHSIKLNDKNLGKKPDIHKSKQNKFYEIKISKYFLNKNYKLKSYKQLKFKKEKNDLENLSKTENKNDIKITSKEITEKKQKKKVSNNINIITSNNLAIGQKRFNEIFELKGN